MPDNNPIDIARKEDAAILQTFLRRQNKEVYSLRNERAWKTMAHLMCNDRRFQTTKVYRLAGKITGFYTMLLQPAEFWKSFLELYGPLRFFWNRLFMPKEQNELTLPIDEEFLQRAKTRYETISGKAYGFYVYTDPHTAHSLTAISLMEAQIQDAAQKGFITLESEIAADNKKAKRMDEILGFEIRPIGDMYYAIKKLGE